MDYVVCSECDRQQTSEEMEFLDVSEDAFGRDVIMFQCCNCAAVVESFVFVNRRGVSHGEEEDN